MFISNSKCGLVLITYSQSNGTGLSKMDKRWSGGTPLPQCGERFHRYYSSAYSLLSTTFIFAGYVQPQKILRGNIFGLILKNKIATRVVFPSCVIATIFKFSGEINYYKRLLENIVFGACMYVCSLARWAKFTFGTANTLLYRFMIFFIFFLLFSIKRYITDGQ